MIRPTTLFVTAWMAYYPSIATASGGEADQLRHWALSRCIAKAFDHEDVREDGYATASAYLEASVSRIEVFEEMDRLADQFLRRQYVGKDTKARYQVRKCIELMDSEALKKLIATAVKKRHRH